MLAKYTKRQVIRNPWQLDSMFSTQETNPNMIANDKENNELRKESARLTNENNNLVRENDALRGEVHLLRFKIELLVDMLTLANLDCNKLQVVAHCPHNLSALK